MALRQNRMKKANKKRGLKRGIHGSAAQHTELEVQRGSWVKEKKVAIENAPSKKGEKGESRSRIS